MILDCDIPLPELPVSRAARASIRARVRGGRAPLARGPRWTPVDREDWIEVSRRPGEWRIRFPRLADFIVSRNAALVTASATSAIPEATLRHLLIDQVIPLMLSARGHLILHGSAVAGPGGGVIFAGVSGSGKSTLAVSFAVSGWKLLSDDVVRVQPASGRVRVIAAYAGARMWPDVLSVMGRRLALKRIAHYSEKRRLPLEALSASAASSSILRRVYLLSADGDAVTIRTVPMREALMALLSHATRLDTDDGAAEARWLHGLADLCQTVCVRSISYPRDLRRLEDVRRAIAADLASDRAHPRSKDLP